MAEVVQAMNAMYISPAPEGVRVGQVPESTALPGAPSGPQVPPDMENSRSEVDVLTVAEVVITSELLALEVTTP